MYPQSIRKISVFFYKNCSFFKALKISWTYFLIKKKHNRKRSNNITALEQSVMNGSKQSSEGNLCFVSFRLFVIDSSTKYQKHFKSTDM